jgi:hypothetical protein
MPDRNRPLAFGGKKSQAQESMAMKISLPIFLLIVG